MQVTGSVQHMRQTVRGGPAPALVPTMGALHAGHMALIERARQLAPRIVVSIFVNPTQFGPHEDFNRYPRPIDHDLEMCRQARVNTVFHPPVEEIYPPSELPATIDVPALSGILEGAHRPGHFAGVCRVVAKLLNIVQPSAACFGMKDYQQLRIIEAMVEALCLPVRIERCPTVREEDGLAMSSRNVYLDPVQRRHALGLSKALREAEHMIRAGETSPARVEAAMRQIIAAHHIELDYAVIRNAHTLKEIDLINPAVEPVTCLVAGRLGDIRLIDNVLMGRPD
jgi:pantoate--beta-alanine ligase